MKRVVKEQIPKLIIPVSYALFTLVSIAMLKSISQYVTFDNHVGFLEFKQEYISNVLWKTAFYIHVFSCFFCLFAGFTQFSTYVQREQKRLHRSMGKAYAYNIIFLNFPVGFILAVYANGMIPSKIAFITLDVLWFWFTVAGIKFIKSGDLRKHKEFMIRSFALTLSALTLRLWKQVFTHLTDLDYPVIYMIDAWMGFVPNLIFAEWLIRRKRKILAAKIYRGKENESRNTNQGYKAANEDEIVPENPVFMLPVISADTNGK